MSSSQNPSSQSGTGSANTAVKLEDPSLHNRELENINWDSERQLVYSLSKLQELESKVHELRSLLPDRLFAPLGPIVDPRRSSSSHPIPRNPQVLNALLRKSATEGVTEINNFKDLWLSPDMQAVWSRVDEKLAENKGAFPQPSGTWQQDYDVILKQMDEEEEERGKRMAETKTQLDGERGKVQQQQPSAHPSIYGRTTTGGGAAEVKTIVDSFQKRQIPGFRIVSSKNESMIVVSLGLAGIIFEIQEVLTTTTASDTISEINTTSSTTTPGTSTKQSLSEWRVSVRQQSLVGKPGSSSSRLETAIVQQLNSRSRKWDLQYLLELILAYSNIRSTPCKKCNQLTDSSAKLPVIRKPVFVNADNDDNGNKEKQHQQQQPTAGVDVPKDNNNDNNNNTTSTSNNEGDTVWEAYHIECV